MGGAGTNVDRGDGPWNGRLVAVEGPLVGFMPRLVVRSAADEGGGDGFRGEEMVSGCSGRFLWTATARSALFRGLAKADGDVGSLGACSVEMGVGRGALDGWEVEAGGWIVDGRAETGGNGQRGWFGHRGGC